jgi:hypothetical protein
MDAQGMDAPPTSTCEGGVDVVGGGYRAPHEWVCAEDGAGSCSGSEGEEPLSGVFAADEGAVEAAAREAAAVGSDARNLHAVDAILSRMEMEYAAVVGAGGGGGSGGGGGGGGGASAAPAAAGDPAAIRSPALAAALAGRPELRAKLEALKRARATWVSFEGAEGGGGGGGGGEAEEFPDDYGELQAADAQALQAATAAASPQPAAAAAAAGGAPAARPVSPLSEAKRAAITAAMAGIKISPRFPPSPFLEKAVDASLRAGKASIEAHRQLRGGE